MATVKLTKGIREDIRDKMLKHRFSEEVGQLIKDRAAFAQEVYNDCYSKKTRDAMSALPEGWLPTGESVCVEIAGKFERLNFNGAFGYYDMRNCIPSDVSRDQVSKLFQTQHKGSCIKVYDGLDAIASKYTDLDNRKKDLEERFYQVKRQVEAALSAPTTLNRLKELWPEAIPFCAVWEDHEGGSNLPALPTTKLNELLNLPVEEAA